MKDNIICSDRFSEIGINYTETKNVPRPQELHKEYMEVQLKEKKVKRKE